MIPLIEEKEPEDRRSKYTRWWQGGDWVVVVVVALLCGTCGTVRYLREQTKQACFAKHSAEECRKMLCLE